MDRRELLGKLLPFGVGAAVVGSAVVGSQPETKDAASMADRQRAEWPRGRVTPQAICDGKYCSHGITNANWHAEFICRPNQRGIDVQISHVSADGTRVMRATHIPADLCARSSEFDLECDSNSARIVAYLLDRPDASSSSWAQPVCEIARVWWDVLNYDVILRKGGLA